MAAQVLSRDKILEELDAITIEYASLLSEAVENNGSLVWRVNAAERLVNLKNRLESLHMPICRLSKTVERIEANTHKTVLLNAINSALSNSFKL